MKPIRLTNHARDRCLMRGASEAEVIEAVESGSRELTKKNRVLCRANFLFDSEWEGSHYPIKQVAPVIVEEEAEIVVVTVYTFYF